MDMLVTLRRKVREFAAIVGGEYYTLGCALLDAAVHGLRAMGRVPRSAAAHGRLRALGHGL